MKRFTKIASLAMAAVMLLSTVPFSASAAAKKAVTVSNQAKSVKISWKKTAKAGKYKVYRSIKKNKGFKAIGTTKKLSFLDKKAKAGKTYYYTVKTTKKTKAAYKTVSIVRLAAPTLKSVVAESTGNRVTLKWTKVTGAKSYGIYYAKVVSGKTKKFQEYYSVDKTSDTIILDKAGTYKFKIVAQKGNSKSVFSNVKKINFVETPDVILTVGEKNNEIATTIDFIKAFGAAMGIELDITAEFEIANPEIVTVDADYNIVGLAAGETTVKMTLKYEVAGEKMSETTTIKVVVKEGTAEPTEPTTEAPTATETEPASTEAPTATETEPASTEAPTATETEGTEAPTDTEPATGDTTTTEPATGDTTTTEPATGDTTTTEPDTGDTTKITEEEAIALVQEKLGDEFTYFVEEELEEKDGNQYYVVCVNTFNGTNSTTVTKYLVKTDGTEVFDKYAEEETVITEEEAIALVQAHLGDEFTYFVEEELKSQDGFVYYVVCVNTFNGTNSTTVTKYLVSLDGTQVFDMYAE